MHINTIHFVYFIMHYVLQYYKMATLLSFSKLTHQIEFCKTAFYYLNVVANKFYIFWIIVTQFRCKSVSSMLITAVNYTPDGSFKKKILRYSDTPPSRIFFFILIDEMYLQELYLLVYIARETYEKQLSLQIFDCFFILFSFTFPNILLPSKIMIWVIAVGICFYWTNK